MCSPSWGQGHTLENLPSQGPTPWQRVSALAWTYLTFSSELSNCEVVARGLFLLYAPSIWDLTQNCEVKFTTGFPLSRQSLLSFQQTPRPCHLSTQEPDIFIIAFLKIQQKLL